jgi:hypothetical protein
VRYYFLIISISFLNIIFKPVPIDLVEQHGAENHHGHGDVIELWEENIK